MGIAWITAGRLLRPVRDVTETARTITETDLSPRIPVEGNDEIADAWPRTFNEMLDRLEAAFAAQRPSSTTPATSCAHRSRSCRATSS